MKNIIVDEMKEFSEKCRKLINLIEIKKKDLWNE